jgi:hypothetical protein
MFCPQCKAEYRPGFTHCADCDVDLVWELPKRNTAARRADGSENDYDNVSGEPGDPNEDPFCSFWKGEDPRVHAELCSVLDDAGIPHHTVFRRDHLFNLRNYPAYEVGVPFSMFQRAENAVKEAYGADDVLEVGSRELQEPLPDRMGAAFRKLPETLTPPPEEEIPGPPTAGEGTDWFPEDATVRVWSSDKGEPGDFLVAALHENGIRCRLDRNVQREELYVLPEDEERARAIVREVVAGEPPEK